MYTFFNFAYIVNASNTDPLPINKFGLYMLKDMSVSAVVAGFVAILIGFSSSVSIIIQAAYAAGANAEIVISWIMALGIGMGITSFGFSLYYRKAIITAWSTPGAALLVTSLTDVTYPEAIGIFIFSGVLTVFVGVSGLFQKLMSIIPLPIACAMLAGVLFQFGLAIFDSLALDFYLVTIMLIGYLVAKRIYPRYAILIVLLLGLITVITTQKMAALELSTSYFDLDGFIWTMPEWSLSVLLGVGLPLFVVTMTAQNMPGIVALKAHNINVSASPLITWTGITTVILAPLGGFAFNLAAITAAICMGEESHKDVDKRYIAGLSAGVFYCIAGLAGSSVVALFIALPTTMVAALAGLALLGTIGTNLKLAMEEDATREAALVTFLVTISGVSFAGIASAFWGIVFGLICLLITRWKKKKTNG